LDDVADGCNLITKLTVVHFESSEIHFVLILNILSFSRITLIPWSVQLILHLFWIGLLFHLFFQIFLKFLTVLLVEFNFILLLLVISFEVFDLNLFIIFLLFMMFQIISIW